MKEKKKIKPSSIIILLVTIVLAILFLYPVYFAVISAFKSNGEILKNPLAFPTELYLQNFKDLFAKTDFFTAIWHTIFLTVVSEVLIILVVPLAAYAIVSYAIEARLDSYNELTKFCYYYDYSSEGSFDYDYRKYDNLRLILTGEAFPNESDLGGRIRQEVELFLYYLNKTDSNIEATHFFYAPEGKQPVLFHRGNYNNQLFDDRDFLQELSLENLERESRQMLICPTHSFAYTRFTDGTRQVLTVGRNYFDLTRAVGQEQYVGTLLIDLNLSEFDRVFADLKLSPDIVLYVVDGAGNCCFSTDEALTGRNLRQDGMDYDVPAQEGMLLSQQLGGYGLTVWLRSSGIPAAAEIGRIRNMMYLCLLLSLAALFIGSIFFSRRLTQPIRAIMNEMAKVETGQFKEQIPVTSHDELGELTA